MRSFTALALILALALPAAHALANPPRPKQRPAHTAAAAAKPAEKAAIKAADEDAPAMHAMPANPPAAVSSGEDIMAKGEALPATDTEEGALPDYPIGARMSIGKMQSYTTSEEDTFLDIARHYDLGYVELRAANPTVDPWSATPGTELMIPSFNLLPRARQQGVVVNLGKMRLYYFRDPGKPPLTYPLGIGQEGLRTPTGDTSIVNKIAGPSWHPTDRMRKLKPYLPASVGPGPSNPLGTHALYLGWPTFLIHGSNKPWGIGRRVSSGCMRMYPEDIVDFFGMIPVGTKVTVVDQPILVAWLDDGLYLEANPTQTQSSEIEYSETVTEKPMTDGMKQTIIDTAGKYAKNINWDVVEKVLRERRGYPVLIASPDGSIAATDMPAAKSKTADAVHTGGYIRKTAFNE